MNIYSDFQLGKSSPICVIIFTTSRSAEKIAIWVALMVTQKIEEMSSVALSCDAALCHMQGLLWLPREKIIRTSWKGDKLSMVLHLPPREEREEKKWPGKFSKFDPK